jgi:hypothetical protein
VLHVATIGFTDQASGSDAWVTVNAVQDRVSLIVVLYGNGDPSVLLSQDQVAELRRHVQADRPVPTSGGADATVRLRSLSADPGDELWLEATRELSSLRLEVLSTWGSEVLVHADRNAQEQISEALETSLRVAKGHSPDE